MLDISNAFFVIAGRVGLILIACGYDNILSVRTRWKVLILASILYIIGISLVAVEITLR